MKIVTSQYINGDAGYVLTCIEDYQKDLAKLTQIVAAVKTAWNGKDADDFVKKYQEILNKLKKYEENFIVYKNYLGQIQGIYQTLEDDYNKKINTD